MSLTADELIDRLCLTPHPEGGYFREMFRDRREQEGRAASTAIYYLLKPGESSHWHRIDAVEIWHHYAGGPLELKISPDGKSVETLLLGTDFNKGEEPQRIVPAGVWQAARPVEGWVLVGCTVAPGFLFETFEMAPPDWTPGG
ncbi:cupin domain-containing protein [Parvularcula marina]|uniref:cupin domain-containing protein n=1 Tax=Parvularcula marina TaxID=2292771 RepID=UPI00351696A5